MDFFTHFLIGILTSIYLLNTLPFSIIVYAACMSIIADFDIFLAPLKLIKKSSFLSHKGLSHSYFTGLIFSIFTGLIFIFITGESFIIAWMIGFLFYSLHVSLDLISASKIPIFYPFSKKRYRFFIDRAINLFLALTSGLLMLCYIIFFFFLPELYYSNLFHCISGFYITYFSYRFVSKIWIQLRLPHNSLYIPGTFPFTYFVYEFISSERSHIYQFKKKIQFSKKNSVILQTEIFKESEEMRFYEKALQISREYIFFSKWKAIIPIIEKSDDYSIIFLLLGESYFSGSTYTLKVVFNRKTESIEKISDGFNLWKR